MCNAIKLVLQFGSIFFGKLLQCQKSKQINVFTQKKKMFSTSFSIFSWNCTIFFHFHTKSFIFRWSFFRFRKSKRNGPFPKIHFRREKNESLFFFICPAATLWDFQKTFFSISCKNALLRKLLSIAWRLKSSQLSFSSFCRLNLWTTMKTTRNFV